MANIRNPIAEFKSRNSRRVDPVVKAEVETEVRHIRLSKNYADLGKDTARLLQREQSKMVDVSSVSPIIQNNFLIVRSQINAISNSFVKLDRRLQEYDRIVNEKLTHTAGVAIRNSERVAAELHRQYNQVSKQIHGIDERLGRTDRTVRGMKEDLDSLMLQLENAQRRNSSSPNFQRQNTTQVKAGGFDLSSFLGGAATLGAAGLAGTAVGALARGATRFGLPMVIGGGIAAMAAGWQQLSEAKSVQEIRARWDKEGFNIWETVTFGGTWDHPPTRKKAEAYLKMLDRNTRFPKAGRGRGGGSAQSQNHSAKAYEEAMNALKGNSQATREFKAARDKALRDRALSGRTAFSPIMDLFRSSDDSTTQVKGVMQTKPAEVTRVEVKSRDIFTVSAIQKIDFETKGTLTLKAQKIVLDAPDIEISGQTYVRGVATQRTNSAQARRQSRRGRYEPHNGAYGNYQGGGSGGSRLQDPRTGAPLPPSGGGGFSGGGYSGDSTPNDYNTGGTSYSQSQAQPVAPSAGQAPVPTAPPGVSPQAYQEGAQNYAPLQPGLPIASQGRVNLGGAAAQNAVQMQGASGFAYNPWYVPQGGYNVGAPSMMQSAPSNMPPQFTPGATAGPGGTTVDPGAGSSSGTWKKLNPVDKDGRPASIRYNNPGAAWPRPGDEKFGIEGYGVIGGQNKIGKFPTAVHGLAANMDLFRTSKHYRGQRLGDAIRTWRGNNVGSSIIPKGYDQNEIITDEKLNDPKWMVPLFRAFANHEAGKNNQLTDEQVQQAYSWYQAGGIEEAKKAGTAGAAGQSVAAEQPLQPGVPMASAGRVDLAGEAAKNAAQMQGAAAGTSAGTSDAKGTYVGDVVNQKNYNPNNVIKDAFNGRISAGSPAVDKALTMLGAHERKDRQAVIAYLRAGGEKLDPSDAWCAAFVNSSLQQAGIKGTGSDVATSFRRWGNTVADAKNTAKGDILVLHRGNAAGKTGGHVGLATGEQRWITPDGKIVDANYAGKKSLQLEMLGGNQGRLPGDGKSSTLVSKGWYNAGELDIRRHGEETSLAASSPIQQAPAASPRASAVPVMRGVNRSRGRGAGGKNTSTVPVNRVGKSGGITSDKGMRENRLNPGGGISGGVRPGSPSGAKPPSGGYLYQSKGRHGGGAKTPTFAVRGQAPSGPTVAQGAPQAGSANYWNQGTKKAATGGSTAVGSGSGVSMPRNNNADSAAPSPGSDGTGSSANCLI